MNSELEDEIKTIYESIKPQIEQRLEEFNQIGKRNNNRELFKELVFCLMTPQSKAKVCWGVTNKIFENDFIYKTDKSLLIDAVHTVRFKNKKAQYILDARGRFAHNNNLSDILNGFENNLDARKWLVNNIKGMGYKESSHFLRNIGKGDNIAILDRHILKNLTLLNVIEKYPASISKKNYLLMENNMREYSEYINIEMNRLDFVLWYKEAKEVFK